MVFILKKTPNAFVYKEKIPDAFVSTAFKRQYPEIMNEKRDSKEFSTLFYYLQSITDRKEKIDQWCDNVNLLPVDLSL